MVRKAVFFVSTLLILSGCDFHSMLAPESGSAAIGTLRVQMELVPEYDLDYLKCAVRPAGGPEESYPMEIAADKTEGWSEITLPEGDYSVFVESQKDWDDINGCELYMETRRHPATITGEETTELTLPNPWISGTRETAVEVDVSTMMNTFDQYLLSNRDPGFAGIWLRSLSDDADPYTYEYHFHADGLSGTTLTGSFPLQPGSYEIEVVPENSGHPDWVDDPWWQRELTAGNLDPTEITVDSETTSFNIPTVHFLPYDFTEVPSDGILSFQDNGGTIDFETASPGLMQMTADGPDKVPYVWLTDDVQLGENSIVHLRFELGTRNDTLNGDHPMLHINLLTDYSEPEEDRLLLTLDEDDVNIHSVINGEEQDSGSWSPGAGHFETAGPHDLYFFLRRGELRIYYDEYESALEQPPVKTYTFSEELPQFGGFSLECHQDMKIYELGAGSEITGALSP